MAPRLLTAVAAPVLAAAALASCAPDDDPYDSLSAEAAEYVIPGSDDWGSGELCPDGGACSGAITVEVIERHDWFHISDLAVESDGASGGSVEAELSIAGGRASDLPIDELPAVLVRGRDVDDVESVLSSGFQVWAGVDPENGHVAAFAAFDAEGRLAGIGHAAAEYFTVPVARLAAEADAPSGSAFLGPLLAR